MELSTNIMHLILYSIVGAVAYRCTPQRFKVFVLLLLNLLFYFLCSPKYLLIMVAVGIWTYFCGLKINVSVNRRNWLVAGIVPVATILCLFKYWMPFQGIISALSGRIISLILPLGMSYYILKSISYVADVYSKKIEPEFRISHFLAYVTFFPQIIAGPIQRYQEWREYAVERSKTVCPTSGYYFIASGLFMKIVLANSISGYVNGTFANPAEMDGLRLWLTFFLYAFYILFDFAGYSNIAIGITRLFGIDCIKNFRRPYLALNIKDFWSRWHISLSTWLRDYIYIPLGGSRKGILRKVMNVMITFLVSGMWHGSTLNFVIWGGYHGIFTLLYGGKVEESKNVKRIGRNILTFFIVAAGWVFFASKSLGDSFEFFKGMFTRVSLNMSSIKSAILPFTGDNTCLSFFLVALFFLFVYCGKEINDEFSLLKRSTVLSFIWQVFILSSIILFGSFGSTSFIYGGF